MKTLKQTQEEELKKFDEEFVTKHYEEKYQGKEVVSPWNGDKTGYFDENHVIPREVRQFLLSAMEASARGAIEATRIKEPVVLQDLSYEEQEVMEAYNSVVRQVIETQSTKAKDYMEGDL